MATENISTINADGSGDYTSLSAWWTAVKNNNLVSLDRVEVAEVEGVLTASGTSILNMTGGTYSVDSTRYFWVRAASGHEWNGDLTRKDIGLKKTGAGIAYVVDISVDFTRVGDLLVRDSVVVNGWAAGFTVAGGGIDTDDVTFERCGVNGLIPNTVADPILSYHAGFLIRLFGTANHTNIRYENCVANNIFKSGSASAKSARTYRVGGFINPAGTGDSTNVEYINCTAGNITFQGWPDESAKTLTAYVNGFHVQDLAVNTVKNCLAFNMFEDTSQYSADNLIDDEFYKVTGTQSDSLHDYNASTDTTAWGTNAKTSLTIANEIISDDKDRPNFQTQNGNLVDTGEDQSSDFTDDVKNEQRIAGFWDIGAYERNGVHIYGNTDIFGNTDINGQ